MDFNKREIKPPVTIIIRGTNVFIYRESSHFDASTDLRSVHGKRSRSRALRQEVIVPTATMTSSARRSRHSHCYFVREQTADRKFPDYKARRVYSALFIIQRDRPFCSFDRLKE